MVDAAADALRAAALALTVWAACVGVGSRILPRRADAPDGDALPSWNRPGVAACFGLGVLLALGGLGTALHVPIWFTIGPFLVVGITLAIVGLFGLSRRAVSWLAVGLGALTVGGFLLMALVEARAGLRMPVNQCDELRAYLPMVHRLIETNAIVEPWSYRRLQNLGGFTYLQSVPVSLLGDVGIGLAETLIASVFLGGLFVATGFRSTWTRIACLLFILSIPVLWIPRINAAPVLMIVPLLVAAFAATSEIRTALRTGDRRAALRWSIGVGILLAGIASVRAPALPVAAITVAVGALAVTAVSFKERLRVVAITAAAALIAIGPWLVASWESVGTPLYPLLGGNGNPSVPSERDPSINTIGELVRNSWDFLTSGSLFWVVVAVLAFALIARKALPDASLLVIITLAVIVTILAFSVTLSIASNRDFGRYIAPLAASVAVFFFYETLRALERASIPAGARSPTLAGIAVGVAIAALFAVFSPIAVTTTKFSPLFPSGWNQLRTNEGTWIKPDALTPSRLGTEWRSVLPRIDPEQTIVAVDRPYAIDYDRYDLPSMDFPGWATPTGTFPFFDGPQAKLAHLRGQGFDQLIATAASDDVCFDPAYLQLSVNQLPPPDSLYARYFLDWQNDVTEITERAPDAVQRFGSLLVIDLPKAEDALSRQPVTEG